MKWAKLSLVGVSDNIDNIEARKVAYSLRDMGFVDSVVQIRFETDEGFDLWLRDKKQNFSSVARRHYETPFV